METEDNQHDPVLEKLDGIYRYLQAIYHELRRKDAVEEEKQ
jgi:hypothetical protein